MVEPDESDDATLVTNVDAEINQLLGLFDVPAYVRRGQDLESTLERIHARCRRERETLMEMVRLRLRQWATADRGPGSSDPIFQSPIDALWPLCGVAPPTWTNRPASHWRRRTIARDLIASVERFNQRWTVFLQGLNLDAANRQIDQYNRYYLLEKECSLGSARLAHRHFTPKAFLTHDDLAEAFPALPVPVLVE